MPQRRTSLVLFPYLPSYATNWCALQLTALYAAYTLPQLEEAARRLKQLETEVVSGLKLFKLFLKP